MQANGSHSIVDNIRSNYIIYAMIKNLWMCASPMWELKNKTRAHNWIFFIFIANDDTAYDTNETNKKKWNTIPRFAISRLTVLSLLHVTLR